MDIEDLFSEQIEEDKEPMVIPEYGPCSDDEESKEHSQQIKSKSKKPNLTTTYLQTQPIEKEELKQKQHQEVKEGKVCYKCKINKPSFTNKQDKVCKTCFLDSVVHRFKSSLRNSLKIWRDDLNLICISGGSCSMALLHLIYQSLFGPSQRKMFFKVHILYIEEGSSVYGWSAEQRQKHLQFIADVCRSYNFTYTIIPLEYIYDVDGDLLDLKRIQLDVQEEIKSEQIQQTQLINIDSVQNKEIGVVDIEQKREKLKQLFQSLPSTSSFREDLIFYLKKWLISIFALQYNFKKVLLGMNAHKVAVQLLGQVAKGRGLSIAHEISFIDDKLFGGKVIFMNPMRDFLQKEIGLYNYLNKVEIIAQKPLAEMLNYGASGPSFLSTDLLIEQFFSRLQDKYNVNTVPTVVRLTGKLQKSYGEGDYPFCPLCFGVKGKTNNLLEIGSTIKKIDAVDGSVTRIDSEKDWMFDKFQEKICFGCFRMTLQAVNPEAFKFNLPPAILNKCL